MDIAENHVEGLELQWARGSQEGLAPFAKYNEEERSGRCILLQPLRRGGLSEKEIHYWGDRGTTGREKERMERQYRKTYTKKLYIIGKGTFCPVEIMPVRLTRI